MLLLELKIKSSLSLYSLYYAEACNEFAEPISLRRHCGQATQLLSNKCCSGDEPLATLSDLTNPRFEPQTSRSRDEHVTARVTGRFRRFDILLWGTVVPFCAVHAVSF